MDNTSTFSPLSGRMMESASHLVINGGSFVAAQSNMISSENRKKKLKALYNKVSLNAILNAGGRADPVQCFPGTREEITASIETWIDDQDSVHPIFWLSGPAGAGKSAIAQTIAERCMEREVPMINFFFFRSDGTRSHARPLVATLIYQILDLFPHAEPLEARIEDTLVTNPLIFDSSVGQQFKDLMRHVVVYLRGLCKDCRRLVVIIDGLDECAQEDQFTQQEILRALYALSMIQNSSLKIFISSRADPHLIMAFNELESPIPKIFLDADNYHPSDDIRKMVVGEFNRIKNNHHLSRVLDKDWPQSTDIEEIVTKSSGQFIYAATVMRYIASSPESPFHSFQRVKGLRPVVKNSPFAILDAIYMYILSCVNDWESATDLLATQILTGTSHLEIRSDVISHGRAFAFKVLGYADTDIPSHLAELTALLQFAVETQEIVFYHSSLADFLLDRTRSGNYYINLDEFRNKLALKICHEDYTQVQLGFWHVDFSLTLIKHVNPDITQALLQLPISAIGNPKFINNVWVQRSLEKIKNLYLEHDFDVYHRILTIWITALHDLGLQFEKQEIDKMEEHAVTIWNDLNHKKIENILPQTIVESDPVGHRWQGWVEGPVDWEGQSGSEGQPGSEGQSGWERPPGWEGQPGWGRQPGWAGSPGKLDQGNTVLSAVNLWPAKTSKSIPPIGDFSLESLAGIETREAWDELFAAERLGSEAVLSKTLTPTEIETVSQETINARKALIFTWAEVGRAVDIRDAVHREGQAEADALRAEVQSVRNELQALHAALANIQGTGDSWTTISRHPANSSTLFLYQHRTSGECKNQWIVI